MSDANEAAGAVAQEPRPQERASDGARGNDKARADDGARANDNADAEGSGGEQPPERDPFEDAARGPLGGAGGTGGSRAARAARRNWAGAERVLDIQGDSQYYEGNVFVSQHVLEGAPAVVNGPVPADELRRLGEVYAEVPGYGRMKKLLRGSRLLVLSGEPGSGRTATALALLEELARSGVERFAPQTSLSQLQAKAVEADHGYVLEVDCTDGRSGDVQDVPSELHLDRLSALLTKAGAYAVVLVASGYLNDRLLHGRYGMRCTPPPTRDVLDRHLRFLLADAEGGALAEARELARSARVQEALGLEELRPAEAARLAGHLATRQRGELTKDQLLDACARFGQAQAREWFAGADAPGVVPDALPSLNTAAFRLAVAVFNGSSYSLAAEAAEQLTWEFSVTLDPENAPGRRLFGTHAGDRPATARAAVYEGELDLGDDQVPVRAIRFEGSGLATAVLHEVWHGYHNARGPVSRWLRTLCDDPRPQVWVRASLAAGVLCAWDWMHGYDELVAPMAGSDSSLQQMAAATALAQASREPSVQPVVKSLLSQWAGGHSRGGRNLRATAILTHGYGLAAGSVSASLDELGKLARLGGPSVLPDVAHSVLRLLAGASPGTVIGRLGDWLRDGRGEYRDLVLLTAVSALRTRTTYLWGLEDVPELEAHAAWPCAAALVATRPQQSRHIADLVRYALTSVRSGAAALDAMESWMRQAAGDEAQLNTVCGFLPQLVADVRDAERLRSLLERMVRDVDEPLDKQAARRMWEAVESEMEQ